VRTWRDCAEDLEKLWAWRVFIVADSSSLLAAVSMVQSKPSSSHDHVQSNPTLFPRSCAQPGELYHYLPCWSSSHFGFRVVSGATSGNVALPPSPPPSKSIKTSFLPSMMKFGRSHNQLYGFQQPNYRIYDWELLAIMIGLKHWQQYLIESQFELTIKILNFSGNLKNWIIIKPVSWSKNMTSNFFTN